MTSYASLRSAVDAMKMGAVDYIAKPFDHDEMVQAVKRILAESDLNKTQAKPVVAAKMQESYPQHGIIGSSRTHAAAL